MLYTFYMGVNQNFDSIFDVFKIKIQRIK